MQLHGRHGRDGNKLHTALLSQQRSKATQQSAEQLKKKRVFHTFNWACEEISVKDEGWVIVQTHGGKPYSRFLALFSQVQSKIDTPGEWQADAQVTRFKKLKMKK